MSSTALDWALTFKIPFEQFPATFISKCEEGDVPEKTDLLQMNRILGDIIRNEIRNPSKAALKIIADKLVKKYPESFRDLIPGYGEIKSNKNIILNRLINYIDNKNRLSNNNLRKRIYSSNCEKTKRVSGPSLFKDKYGTVNFQPSSFPKNEDEQSQNSKKIHLQQEYEKCTPPYDVMDCFNSTYVLQRLVINNKSSCVTSILKEFPYLKHPSCIFNHFQNLMGFSILERLDEELEKKFGDITKFCQQGPAPPETKELLRKLQRMDGYQANEKYSVILLIPSLLKENQSVLFWSSEVKCNLLLSFVIMYL